MSGKPILTAVSSGTTEAPNPTRTRRSHWGAVICGDAEYGRRCRRSTAGRADWSARTASALGECRRQFGEKSDGEAGGGGIIFGGSREFLLRRRGLFDRDVQSTAGPAHRFENLFSVGIERHCRFLFQWEAARYCRDRRPVDARG